MVQVSAPVVLQTAGREGRHGIAGDRLTAALRRGPTRDHSSVSGLEREPADLVRRANRRCRHDVAQGTPADCVACRKPGSSRSSRSAWAGGRSTGSRCCTSSRTHHRFHIGRSSSRSASRRRSRAPARTGRRSPVRRSRQGSRRPRYRSSQSWQADQGADEDAHHRRVLAEPTQSSTVHVIFLGPTGW